MIIHGKNQKIGCFYKLTTQISAKNGQNVTAKYGIQNEMTAEYAPSGGVG